MTNTEMPDTAELPQRVIAVLGMHRSGTSCVTGSLQNYGLFLGEHSTWNRYNTRGNRENQSIVDLNDKVLASSGGDWLEPPTRVVWQEEHLQEARSILAEYKKQPLFGFKDPRTLLTLAGWQSILGDRLQFVGIFRNVAAFNAYRYDLKSVFTIDGIENDKGSDVDWVRCEVAKALDQHGIENLCLENASNGVELLLKAAYDQVVLVYFVGGSGIAFDTDFGGIIQILIGDLANRFGHGG